MMTPVERPAKRKEVKAVTLMLTTELVRPPELDGGLAGTVAADQPLRLLLRQLQLLPNPLQRLAVMEAASAADGDHEVPLLQGGMG